MKQQMIQFLLAITLSVTFTTTHAKEAKCTVMGTSVDDGLEALFHGSCEFEPWRNGGSFSLKSLEGKWEPLWDTIIGIELEVIKKGVAKVSVIDSETQSAHSWGIAKRSQKDSACWIGKGFEICAR